MTALTEPDWPRLMHAYGRATDTEAHLRALVDGDDEARKAAVSHLWGAILHQGTPFPASASVARIVAALLRAPRLPRGAPVRASLVSFLGAVGQVFDASPWSVEECARVASRARELPADPADDAAIFEDEEAGDAMYAQSLLECLRAAPELLEAVRPELDDPDPRVRACAADAVARLAELAGAAADGHDRDRLLAAARAAESAGERCAVVLALGYAGGDTREFLDDASPGVRVCAALALERDDRATGVLVAGLEDAEHLDGWFSPKPPQMAMWPRFTVIANLLPRVADFDRIAEAAIAVVRVTNPSCVDFDWGPLLAAAFPDGDGVVRTASQRRFLEALVARSELWDEKLGNPRKWFSRAGLPYERAACRAKLGLA